MQCYLLYKTERRLNIRSSEHKGISHLKGKKIECKPFTVWDHLLLYNPGSDLNDFTIRCRDKNSFKLLLKYFILISRTSPVLNMNTASIPLFLFKLCYYQWDLFKFLCNTCWHNNIIISLIRIDTHSWELCDYGQRIAWKVTIMYSNNNFWYLIILMLIY